MRSLIAPLIATSALLANAADRPAEQADAVDVQRAEEPKEESKGPSARWISVTKYNAFTQVKMVCLQKDGRKSSCTNGMLGYGQCNLDSLRIHVPKDKYPYFYSTPNTRHPESSGDMDGGCSCSFWAHMRDVESIKFAFLQDKEQTATLPFQKLIGQTAAGPAMHMPDTSEIAVQVKLAGHTHVLTGYLRSAIETILLTQQENGIHLEISGANDDALEFILHHDQLGDIQAFDLDVKYHQLD